MIFEGSEKKLEVVFNDGGLLKKPTALWDEIVQASKAQILNDVETSDLIAFLLSESSLFVWDDRILMITCGTTTLANAADKIVEKFGKENIQSLIFQRKNEYCGHLQNSSFFDDQKLLDEHFDSKAIRFGNYDEHHLFLYHLTKEYIPEKDDETFELLAYNLRSDIIDFLTKSQSKEDLRNFFEFEKHFKDYILDDFVFKPYGYSINGIKGSDYFTIHITPQDCHSYVSFESSLDLSEIAETFLPHFLKALKPDSFDFISFSPEKHFTYEHPKFQVKKRVEDKIDCGYYVSFTHYFNPKVQAIKPINLK
ncbi:MAG: adenosylmethionine decarboxylase [Bacteriovoracaceae bacterium]